MDREDMKNDELNALYPLKDIGDLEVSDNDPDVRGWDVYGADGTKIGEVEELIVNPAEMKVRYLDIELDKNIVELNAADNNDERHIIIPIGRAILDKDDDRVIIEGVQVTGLGNFPVYTGDLSREYQDKVLNSFEMNNQDRISNGDRSANTGNSNQSETLPPTAKHDAELNPDNYYNSKDFDEGKFYGNRRINDSVGGEGNSLTKRS